MPRAESISVCMATYNGSAYLDDQVKSILAQLRPGDELLVADDGSTDGTLSILLGYGAAVRVVATDRVGGVVPNFARVLMHASKPLVVLADQDDVWMKGRLQSIRDALAEVDLVITNALVTDERLTSTGATLFEEVGAAPGFWRNVRRRSSFVGCCMGFRSSLLRIALPFPDSTPWHDWLIGLLGCATGRVRLLQDPQLLYRRHVANASATGKASRNSLWRMFTLRISVLYAVGVCLLRWQLRRFRAVVESAAP